MASGVHTVGNVSFTGPVTLTGDVYIDTVEDTADTSDTDGTVTFSSTIDGNKDLWILSGSGNVTISGAIGSENPLTGLAINTGTDDLGAL